MFLTITLTELVNKSIVKKKSFMKSIGFFSFTFSFLNLTYKEIVFRI